MDFSPYHRFRNSERLENAISKLERSQAGPPHVFEKHHQYHLALLHKLKYAMHYIQEFERIVTSTKPEETLASNSEFLFDINRNIDGFFSSIGSAMDILAREVLTYFNQLPSGNVYFENAYDTLSNTHPGDAILDFLTKPRWRDEFRNYRNASTHEVILTTSHIVSINHTQIGVKNTSITVPLPDDPRALPAERTFERNPNAFLYIKSTLYLLLDIISRLYYHIAQRANAQGSLPLQ